MKIAKILIGNPDDRKGFFNNVIERTKHLIEVEPEVDCYLIRVENGLILRLLKRQFRASNREDFSIIEGIKFRNIWIKMGLLNYLITHRLHKRIVLSEKQLSSYVKYFEKYDLLSSHGIEAIFLSALVKRKFGIPFVSTWHGSDINITPFQSSILRNESKKLLEYADHNFFVSQKLLDTSEKISTEAKKSVLYTGPSSIFYKYTDTQKQVLRDQYNIQTSYVIGFIGNFVSIKNVLVLPTLFKKIQEEINDISFVVIGNGSLGSQLTSDFMEQDINNLHMLGKLSPEEIPDIMNIFDLLVLPSLNEGMPRVTLEAQACGAHVVGSNRGGIPEAIGNENCFELNDSFIDNAVSRISELLKGEVENPVLPEKFSWINAIKKELLVYKHAYSK